MVTYVDSSVILADLLREPKRPAKTFWSAPMISSILLRHEVIVRLHALKSPKGRLTRANELMDAMSLSDLNEDALKRSLSPLPVSVRTLDAIHLSTMDYVRTAGLVFEVATYDKRLANAARAMGFTLAPL